MAHKPYSERGEHFPTDEELSIYLKLTTVTP